LNIDEELIAHKRDTIKLFHTITDYSASMSKNIHDIKEAQAKNNMIIYGIIFLSGIIIGTQYKVWVPYANDIYSTVKHTKELQK